MGKRNEEVKVVTHTGVSAWVILLLILAMGIITILVAESEAFSQECPVGMKCIPDEKAAEIAEILKERQCQDRVLDELEKNGMSEDFTLEYDPYTVIITGEGQVFDQQEMTGNLKWCSLELKIKSKPNLRIMIKEEDPNAEKTWGFRLRVRLAVNMWPKAIWMDDDSRIVAPALALEPFFIRKFHILTWGGFQTFGAGVGLDLTKNADVYLGVGGRWTNAEFGPVLGFSVSLN